jgi:adenosyl cobinamide kinase/adenosyl cobinamide phosphate guanylyltransferase
MNSAKSISGKSQYAEQAIHHAVSSSLDGAVARYINQEAQP